MDKQSVLYDNFLKHVKTCGVLSSVSELIEWDQEVMMPQGKEALEICSLQSGTISSLAHELFIDNKTGDFLEKLTSEDLAVEQQAVVREITRLYQRQKSVPKDLVEKISQTSTKGMAAWKEAKDKNDFSIFAPLLKELIALKKEYAQAINKDRHPYEVIMHDLEPDFSLEEVKVFLEEIKKGILPLIKTTKDIPKIRETNVSEKVQKEFSLTLLEKMGYDFSKGRLDTSAHPFTACYGRITTRFSDNWEFALKGTIHEMGHAKYEHGLPLEHFGTPLGSACSFAIHESQSRFWENVVGRSKSFLSWLQPQLQENYAIPIVSQEDFFSSWNNIKPSFIRVDADEVTYCLHIIIRFEIELALFQNELSVEEIPKRWNELYQEYLGILPKTNAEGCLQDVHWSMGAFGYFHTYALGTAFASSFFSALLKDIPTINEQIKNGNFKEIDVWLKKNIWSKGRRYTAKELIETVTKKQPTAKDYVAYLQEKYA